MKVVNFVLGLGTAIILAALITLGIKAFYPEPVAPTYPNYPVTTPILPCPSNDTACQQQDAQLEAQQQAQQTTAQDTYNQQETAYETAQAQYDTNLFIIANIIGIIVFAFGFWLLFATEIAAQSVPIGIMIAGTLEYYLRLCARLGERQRPTQVFHRARDRHPRYRRQHVADSTLRKETRYAVRP